MYRELIFSKKTKNKAEIKIQIKSLPKEFCVVSFCVRKYLYEQEDQGFCH